MRFDEQIFERFSETSKRDAERLDLPPWMQSWLYEQWVEDQGTRWIDFRTFTGKDQIVDAFRWSAWHEQPNFLAYKMFRELVEKSVNYDQQFFDRIGKELPESINLGNIGAQNAQDYTFQHAYPVPEEQQVKRVLDFGAGYGRQINLWSQATEGDWVYVALDAIPLLYCLQHLYFSAMDIQCDDYVLGDTIDLEQATAPRIAHLPTWRHDLLPNDFFDMVICVQVLGELPQETLLFAISMFQRVLKPGGALYLRDHDSAVRLNKMPINEILKASGFVLEFRPHIVDRVHLHGIPRIWRKINPAAIPTMG